MRALSPLLSAAFLLAACETSLPIADDLPASGADAATPTHDSGSVSADAEATLDAGSETPDAGEADAGAPDAGEIDAGEPDAGSPDAGAGCVAIVPTTQPLQWRECYSADWPAYNGGMEHVLATWFTGMASGAAEWNDLDDHGFYLALPMSWVHKGRLQADYNVGTYSLIVGASCTSYNFCDPPRTNIPPRPWGMQFCVLSHTTGRSITAQLVDSGPADKLRTALTGAYGGAQTWIDLSPGAAAYLATGDAYGTPDNQIVTFWEGACQ